MRPQSAVALDRRAGWLVYPLHRWAIELSRGLLGGTFDGRPIMLLRTTGARTGRTRTVPMQYYRDGHRLLIVGSNGGRPKPPAWLANLRRSPEVSVLTRPGGWQPKRARVLGEEERAGIWPTLTAWYPGYAHYETLTDRPLHVVELTSGASSGGA